MPLHPSLGYNSLRRELDDINKKIDIASDSLEYYSPKLVFGKVNNSSSSSIQLIRSYQDTQLKIIDILDQSQWLEIILSQFF